MVEASVINSHNVASYKNVIVPELYSSVRGGNIEMNAASKLEFIPEPNPLFASLRDPKEFPNEFLDGVSKALGAERVLSVEFSLTALHDNKLGRELQGTLFRIYPLAINPQDKTGQVFREKARVFAPKALSGFSWLTFRFQGIEEDVHFVYSPALKKSRQLTGSNRADGILTTSFSLDDIFTWTGKRELVDGELVSRGTYLIPFGEVSVLAGNESEETCVEFESAPSNADYKGGLSKWNITSRKFPQAAGWIPTSSVFVPRELVRIELESRDPYSVYGRQILYIDFETLLPVYKFVFDRSGHPWKTVMTGYGWLKSPNDKDKQIPIPMFTIVDDALKGDSYIFDISRFRACKNIPESLQSESFDPKRLGDSSDTPQVSPQPSSSPPVTPTAQSSRSQVSVQPP